MTVKAIASILYNGPERVFAEKVAGSELNIKVVLYVEKLQPNPKHMAKIYAGSPEYDISYVKKVGRRQLVHLNHLGHSCFESSERLTSYYLIDKFFVTYPATLDETSSKQNQINQIETREEDLTIRLVTAFDDTVEEERDGSIKKAMQAWNHAVGVNCLKTFAATFVLGVVVFLAPQTPLWAMALKITSLVAFTVFALAGFRLIQFIILQSKINQISNLGLLVAQVRQWAYQYPILAQQYSTVQKCLGREEQTYLQEA